MTLATQPRLISLATANPPHHLEQGLVAVRAGELFAARHGGQERLAPIFHHTAIEMRQVSAPLDWFFTPRSFAERNDLFLKTAVDLLAQAAIDALARADVSAQAIDTLVTISSTGIATPALDARLMEVVPFRRDVQRLPVFGLGCAGGVLGLARAAAMAKAEPRSNVLLLVVELCSLTFRYADRSKSNLIATALFGDGAAAAVVRCEGASGGRPVLGPCREHTWPGSLEVMGWDVADDGLRVIFSRDIPALVREDLAPVVTTFLADHDLTFDDIDAFLCHPGGAKVLDALEEAFGLDRGALIDARGVLRDHGNMSAVTVLFVLERALARGAEGRFLLTTLGPGFTAGLLLVDVPGRDTRA